MHTVSEASFPWLTTIILLAAAGALALWLIKPLRKFARPLALGLSVVVAALYVVALVTEFDVANAGTIQVAENYSWIPQLGVSLAWGINGMGAVMIALSVFLVPVVILASSEIDDERIHGYLAWVLALEAIIIGLFAARDLFVFYVLFELMIIPIFFMIGRYGKSENRRRAAMKFLIYSLLGGLIMLVGVIAVYAYGPGGAGGFMIDNLATGLQISESAQMWVFLAFFIAFAIKAPMWPVHTWLPDATEEAPAGTSTLLVGILDKMGTFGMIAICLPIFPQASTTAAPVIMVLALVSIIWGALMAIASKNLMRLVAYTSVSHFGFMVLGIFSGSTTAMAGAILYMVAHGVGTAALFLVVGFLGQRGKSHMIADYGGWQRVTPLIAGAFLIAGLATIALPGLSGFIPEFMVLMGTFKVRPVFALVAVIGVVLAALYILLPYQRVFTGPKPDVEAKDLDGREKVVVGVLIAAMLGLGIYPAPALEAINPVAEQYASYVDLSEGSNK
ncbi:NADH-quinone oxidoreductase subunit M [Trueperella bialowiezensis]|uniref:NAD(P)H-quinone oxidoreductase chain 4 1 n=1 Tax=Trueperella bialowiezensis TaxID=312285 RepID=A0A3S4VGQ7_9ACTO|nr:NADH-quinone oxidoreductase subunit M [Trueperella bialowiezensis]VEI13710.1 NAD(P)H-quinone oxidoreductase chain 4 1 [Trueperella bialowiezensis]